jgi:hypothetical protein
MSYYVVDADSQFVQKSAALPDEWFVDERVAALVDAGYLLFGHRTFGQFHHVFAVRLRGMKTGRILREIADDAAGACKRCLGGMPSLILFPGDSTAGFILEDLVNVVSGFPGPESHVLLSPAFRGYGTGGLRMELSAANRRVLASPEPLRILFFDDSISTGNTQRRALDAFLSQRSKNKPPQTKDSWLTYAVVRRRARLRPGDSVITARDAMAMRRELEKAFICDAQFCSIGPEASTAVSCPFVPAAQRMRAVAEWAKTCRGGIRQIVLLALRWVSERELEDAGPG